MSPRAGDVVDQGLVAGDKDFRYRTKLQAADYNFAYRVEVSRYVMPSGHWEEIGGEYAAWRWSARWGARKIRRRHIRRFGR